MKRLIFIFIFFQSIYGLKAQFISKVLEYKPAPGQYINKSPYGIPSAANPESETSIIGRLNGAMTLGAFGGYVVFKFENPVENHPDNPYGIDFVIYGNPIANPLFPDNANNNVKWAEPGIVSVMQDENQNGLPDDTWYELAASDYFFSSTVKNYAVSYTNPNGSFDVPWQDNLNYSGVIPTNEINTQPYYPGESFSTINQTSYTLEGTRINDYINRSQTGSITFPGRSWGYVDNTLKTTYNGLPDNPYTDNHEEGSGGDAFDIHWAVDKQGNYVDLDQIDFIKVHNAVLANAQWLGEISTEITGAFDVAPDNSVTGILDMIVIKDLPDTIKTTAYQLEAFVFYKGRLQPDKSINWQLSRRGAEVDESNMLRIKTAGHLSLTASLDENPDIRTTVSTVSCFSTDVIEQKNHRQYSLYPNPVFNDFAIKCPENQKISFTVFHANGQQVLHEKNYFSNQKITISHFIPGFYIVKIKTKHGIKNLKLIKNK